MNAANSSMPLGVAVVGAGRMGKHHARIYAQLPGCRLEALRIGFD